MIEEIWKDIEGYEGFYQISNFGNVKSLIYNRLIIPDINSTGYLRVSLYCPEYKRFFVHRLVAYYFCPGYAEGLVVNHIDGNKLNNDYYNLEWVTRSENDKHAFRSGLRKNNYRPLKPNYKIATYDENNKLVGYYQSKYEFAKENNCSPNTVNDYVQQGYFKRNDTVFKIKNVKPSELIKPISFIKINKS